jgi:hypothetical protein
MAVALDVVSLSLGSSERLTLDHPLFLSYNIWERQRLELKHDDAGAFPLAGSLARYPHSTRSCQAFEYFL